MSVLRILAILYRDFVIYQLIFTLAACYTLLGYGIYAFILIFWIKIIGYVVIGIWYYQSRRHRLYFYHNLGWSLKLLILFALIMDALTAIPVLILTNVFA